MTSLTRVHGIYDLRTLEILKEQKVRHWAFDLRPRSLNYVPGYKLEEMLHNEGMFADSISLHFCGEKDFVIQKIVSDLKKAYPQIGNRLFLEFSDNEDVSFYESFDLPFLWHYQSDKKNLDILSSGHLRGLIFEDNFIDKILINEIERNFLMNLFSFNPRFLARPIDLILNMTENNSLNRSFFEFLDFSFVSLTLGPEIEICYRNVNLNLLREQLINFKHKEKHYAHSSFQ